MSIDVMTLVWKRAPYQGNTLLTLLALADWSHDDGRSWPSIEKLAAKSRQSERNCHTTIATLKNDGFITIEERPGTSNIIQINLPKLESCKDCTPAKKTNRGGLRMKSLHPGVQTAAQTGEMFAPYTLDTLDDTLVKTDTLDVFNATYKQYPRHVAPRDAKKAWEKAVKRYQNIASVSSAIAEGFISSRVTQYALMCIKTCKEKQFIPHMATWLNQDRFMDDAIEWAVESNGQITKAERRNANISETTRRVFDPARHIPGYNSKGLPDDTS